MNSRQTEMVAKDSYLVIGGCGFLGRHIVEHLLARGEQAVAVFDLVQRHHDKNVQFFTGDICNPNDLGDAIQKVFLPSYLSTLWAENCARRIQPVSSIPHLQCTGLSQRCFGK